MTILCALICTLNAKPVSKPEEKKQYDTGEAAVYRLVKVQFIQGKMFGSSTDAIVPRNYCVYVFVNIDSVYMYSDVSDFMCVF